MSKVEVSEEWDPANPPSGWRLFSANELYRVYEHDNGDGTVVHKREWLNSGDMLNAIAEQRSNNAGQRWGDGQVVGRIPLNLYYASGMADANKQRDLKFQRQFYRDHPKLKTFDGDL
jgi:hypothetical protein